MQAVDAIQNADSHRCMQKLWSGPQYCIPTQDTQIPEVNSTKQSRLMILVPQQLILMNVPINVLADLKLISRKTKTDFLGADLIPRILLQIQVSL